MAVEVVEGVWWLEDTRGCNVYVVRAADGSFVIVDSAFREAAGAIAWQARHIAAGAPITHLLLTHEHFDHTGGASALRDALGVRVALGAADCEPDSEGGWQARRSPLRGRPRGTLARVLAPRSLPATTPVDVLIEARCEVAPGIEAVPVPGHTPGSTCFVLSEGGVPRVTFVGDLVISHREGLSRTLVAVNHDDAQYQESLRLFAEEAPDIGLAGHGYPVRRNFGAALRNLGASEREPWSLRNGWRRARRMAAFNQMLWRPNYPPRR
jgi:glyoxylase-like metal-dependent hydrolase (beta-lactamase superfamily II)